MTLEDSYYNIGDIVYLITDNEQLKRIITCIVITKDEMLYELCQGVEVSRHYYFEISKEKDVVMTSTN